MVLTVSIFFLYCMISLIPFYDSSTSLGSVGSQLIRSFQRGNCLQTLEIPLYSSAHSLTVGKCENMNAQSVTIKLQNHTKGSSSYKIHFTSNLCLGKYPNKTAGLLPCSQEIRGGKLTSIRLQGGMAAEYQIIIGKECLSATKLSFVKCDQLSPHSDSMLHPEQFWLIDNKEKNIKKTKILKNEKATRKSNSTLKTLRAKKPGSLYDDGNYIFNQSTLLKYNLLIADQDLNLMQDEALLEKYVPCSLVTDYSTTSEKVWNGLGCRHKGSFGSLFLCIDAVTGQNNPECRKLSIKVHTSKFLGRKQKIFGLKKLLFHGMPVDRSLVQERLAYTMLNQANIIAPRAVHAMLYINYQYAGIYVLVEDIDSMFSQKRFELDNNKGKGGLYKEVWPKYMDIKPYEDAFKSGKNESNFMVEVATAIQKADVTVEEANEVLNAYFDTKSIIDVIAMHAIMGTKDDWRRHRNYYWYVVEYYSPLGVISANHEHKMLYLIPWDYDRLDNHGVDGEDQNDLSLLFMPPKPKWYEPIDPSLCTSEDETIPRVKSQPVTSPLITSVPIWSFPRMSSFTMGTPVVAPVLPPFLTRIPVRSVMPVSIVSQAPRMVSSLRRPNMGMAHRQDIFLPPSMDSSRTWNNFRRIFPSNIRRGQLNPDLILRPRPRLTHVHSTMDVPIPTTLEKELSPPGNDNFLKVLKKMETMLPDDVDEPIQCDKLTQLIAAALLPKIRERILELSEKIWTLDRIVKLLVEWDLQIERAVVMDPDGPYLEEMIVHQQALVQRLREAQNEALMFP